MSTNTTRLGLTKPSASASPAEAVDVGVINTNMDSIDQWIGCILVLDGVTPATGSLFDGAIVKEKTSGIIWEARKNGGGTFDKVYVRYPLHFQGNSTGAQTITNASATAQANIAGVNSSYCKNSSASNISSNRFVAPVKGIYQWLFRVSWTPNATGDRYLHFMLNGSTITAGDEYVSVRASSGIGGAAQPNTMDLSGTTILDVGNSIAPGVQQTSGGNLDVKNVFVKIALIEPTQ